MSDDRHCKLISLADLDQSIAEHVKKMDAAFEHDADCACLTIKIAYPYHIELARIKSKADLLGWVSHLCHKPWMNTEYLGEFIKRVCKIKRWKLGNL